MAAKQKLTASGETTKANKGEHVKDKNEKRLVTIPNHEKQSFHIVGIGASAGGLAAFEQFFRNMPAESGMGFVLVSHLDPGHTSLMPELIQRYTEMKVYQIEDGIKVQPNNVYMIPPNRDMGILDRTLHLIEPIEPHGRRMSVDYFFRSLAQDQGDKAICIVLSGTGSDGTLGLRAIKDKLGLVIVQDPGTTQYNGMPRSAIATGLPDYVLPPEKMPSQLINYTQHIERKVVSKTATPDEKARNELQKICIILRTQTGHDFTHYKENTIHRRIDRRMNVHQIDTISNYIRYLQQTPTEVQTLFKELLIGVTSFFRDPEAFEHLKQKALSQALQDKPDDYTVRMWVPGCSTGEEAYSMAIILNECMEELDRNYNIQIFGTDIDSDAIDVARAGIYMENISVDVGPDRLKRFFTKKDSVYQIRKDIREMLVFAPQNIIKDPPFTKLDLICCRNLLIYFNSKLQKQIFPVFHFSLKLGGILFLGNSETIGEFVDLFSIIDKKWKIFKRKVSSSAAHPILELPSEIPKGIIPIAKIKKTEQIDVSQLAQRVLMDTCVPPAVLINKKGEILYFHRRTGKYLEPAPGKASLNITEMARKSLKMELASAIRKATAQKKEIMHDGLEVEGNKINLTVKPVSDQETAVDLMLVIFDDIAAPMSDKIATTKRSSEKIPDKRIEELEKELYYTRENLQTTVEELETANEELQSSNEELQSTNEELQSTNEELETSKEELQSLNEELVTVNTELQGKIDELSELNNDMKNLLDSLEIPVIFLTKELLIKRFTPQTKKVAHLIEADIGRPISDFVFNLKYDSLIEDVETVFATLVPLEKEVATKDGHWFLVRIFPYRTVMNMIDGVVVIFNNFHEQKMASEKILKLNQAIQEASEYAESIVDTMREPLLVLDKELRVISANRSFYATFQVEPDQTEAQHIYELGNKQWDIPKLREFLEEIIPENTFFDGFEVEHNFQKIGRKKMLLNARRINPKGSGDELILLVIEDVTEKSYSSPVKSYKL